MPARASGGNLDGAEIFFESHVREKYREDRMSDQEDSGAAGGSSSVEIQRKDRLRVLCIHGYRQNEFSFRSKIGSFRKYVDKYAEFVFISAPHQAPPFPGEEDKGLNGNLGKYLHLTRV